MRIILFFVFFCGAVGLAQQPPHVPSAEQQIAAAVLPLPESMRAGAGVRGYDHDLKPVMLRQTSNSMVCTGQRPGNQIFDVRCYHESFLPVVDRMRDFFRKGGKPEAIFSTIDSEIKTGKLKLPPQPTAGYRMEGPISAYDQKTNTAGKEIKSWQSVHFPYRTAAEIGLPDERDHIGSMPYVMTSGTFWSHVMIVHEPTPASQ